MVYIDSRAVQARGVPSGRAKGDWWCRIFAIVGLIQTVIQCQVLLGRNNQPPLDVHLLQVYINDSQVSYRK